MTGTAFTLASTAWYSVSSAALASACEALTSSKFVTCIENHFVNFYGVGYKVTFTVSPLVDVAAGKKMFTTRITGEAYDTAAGAVGASFHYDLTVLDTEPFVGLLEDETYATAVTPSQVAPFPNAQRLNFAKIMEQRMIAVR